MFHTYITASSGTEVDFNRASFLMDKALLQQSLDAMTKARNNAAPRWDARAAAQWVWQDYCRRHAEKHGEAFVPDVTAGWDRPPAPPGAARADQAPAPERSDRAPAADRIPRRDGGSRRRSS